jgi:hypothetical protein
VPVVLFVKEMAECAVYTPCGRYVVRLSTDVQQQRLWLDVRGHTLWSQHLNTTAISKHGNAADVSPVAVSSGATGVIWDNTSHQSTVAFRAAAVAPTPLHLVASLNEADVVALTSAAGVRKNFTSFTKMLYDALIGRSSCVHFYVETVAEMKDRIQRDVQRHQGKASASSFFPTSSLSPSRASNEHAAGCGSAGGAVSSPTPKVDDVAKDVVAAIDQARWSGTNSNFHKSLSGRTEEGEKGEGARCSGRVRAAIGDTVIEFDEDIAEEALEQRFLTVDYDVDFTRAIFPIPLSQPTANAMAAAAATNSTTTTIAPASRTDAGDASTPTTEADERLRQELRDALARVAHLDKENAKLRKENAALVQLSRQKMEEMQRLCDDFQQRVQDAADAENLRVKNAELRIQLQGAIEERQTVLRTLEKERSQRRLLGPADLRSGGSSSGARQRPLSRKRDNPYLRSLSRDSRASGAGEGRVGMTGRLLSSGRGSVGSSADARLDRHGRPLLSPTPTPTSRRRVSTRFDTPPGPSSHNATDNRSRRSQRASSTHSSTGSVRGGGDSPAPRGRTGGRQGEVVKPRSGHNNCTSSSGCEERRPRSRGSSSSRSMPRRGPSLWADTSDHPSPRGSVASSSRGSSASHERLYRATTASSRQHQTPKAYALEELGARRAVFH